MMMQFKSSKFFESFKYTKYPKPLWFLYVLLFTTITVPFSKDQNPFSSEFKIWLFVGAFVSSFIYLIIVIGEKCATHKYGELIPNYIMLFWAGFVGALKGASTEYLVNIFETHDSFPIDEIAIRAYSGACLAIGLAATFSILTTYQDQIKLGFTKSSAKNRELAREIQMLTSEIQLLRTATKDRLINKMVQNLKPNFLNEVMSLNPEKNWLQISSALKNGLIEKVRAQSHEVGEISLKNPSVKEKLKKSVDFEVFHLHPRIFTLIQFTIGASISYRDWNPSNSALNLLLNSIISLIVTYYFKLLLENSKLQTRTFNVVIFLSVTFMNVLLYAVVRYFLWNEINPIFAVSVLIWHFFLFYVISMVSEIIRYNEDIALLSESVLEDLIDKKRVLEEYEFKLRMDLSKYLHGYLISKLHTYVKELDKKAVDNDFVGYRDLLTELMEELNLEKFRSEIIKDEVSDSFFSALISAWDGLVKISFGGDTTFYRKFQKTQNVELAEVIEEIVVNAHRHGEAQSIHIDFTWLENNDLVIHAINDGKILVNSRSSGLGSQIFSWASDNRWSMDSMPFGGVSLTLTITPYERYSETGASAAELGAFDLPEYPRP